MAKKASRRTTKPATEPKQEPEAEKVVSTVATETVTEVVEEEPRWKMPKPTRGQTILYYPRSIISERNADIGFVTSVGESAIGVTYQGQGGQEVLHVSDPRLKSNPDIRQDIDGLWDWTQEKKEMDAKLTVMNERISRLEEQLNL